LRAAEFGQKTENKSGKTVDIFNTRRCLSIIYQNKASKPQKIHWATDPCLVSWDAPPVEETFAYVKRNKKRKKHSHMKNALALPTTTKNAENQLSSNITGLDLIGAAITGLDLIGARITGLDLIGARITGLDLIGA